MVMPIFECLYCEKENKNVVFCSYECKDAHYEKKKRELKR
jgi:hypothetical protein